VTIRPQALLIFLIYAIPFELLYIPYLPLRLPIDLLIALIVALILWARPVKLRLTGLEGWLIVYLIYATISVFYAALTIDDNIFSIFPEDYGLRGSRYRGLYQLIILLVSYFIALFVVNSCGNRANLRRTIDAIFKITIIVNAFAIYEFIAKTLGLPVVYPRFESWDYISGANIGGIPRVYGVFEEPGTFGRYLIIVILISVVMITNIQRAPEFYRFPLKLTLTTSIVCLLLTLSLSSIMVLLLVISVLMLRQRKLNGSAKRSQYFPLLILAMVGGSMALLGPNEAFIHKIENMITPNDAQFASSETVRTYGMIMGLQAALERPMLGGGFGNDLFYTYMPEVSDLTFGSHNMLVTLLVEGGIIGTSLFGWLFWRVFRTKVKSNRYEQWNEGIIIMKGLKYALAASLIHHFVFGAARLTSMDWLLIGLIIGVSVLSNFSAKILTRDSYASMNGFTGHAKP